MCVYIDIWNVKSLREFVYHFVDDDDDGVGGDDGSDCFLLKVWMVATAQAMVVEMVERFWWIFLINIRHEVVKFVEWVFRKTVSNGKRREEER